MTGPEMVECPEHGGAFDCTPFCARCEGAQEVPAFVGGYECHLCGHEPPEVSTYEMKDGRVFCAWCLPERKG